MANAEMEEEKDMVAEMQVEMNLETLGKSLLREQEAEAIETVEDLTILAVLMQDLETASSERPRQEVEEPGAHANKNFKSFMFNVIFLSIW
jgi:hypothetical protein